MLSWLRKLSEDRRAEPRARMIGLLYEAGRDGMTVQDLCLASGVSKVRALEALASAEDRQLVESWWVESAYSRVKRYALHRDLIRG